MEFKRKYGQRRQTNPKRGILLVILLVLVLYLFFNAEQLFSKLLN